VKLNQQTFNTHKFKIARLTYNWLTLGFWRIELQYIILYIVTGVYKPTYDWGAPPAISWDLMEGIYEIYRGY
jgi:hypothetical protein